MVKGNARDYYMGVQDSDDRLLIGQNSTFGSGPAIWIDSGKRTQIRYHEINSYSNTSTLFSTDCGQTLYTSTDATTKTLPITTNSGCIITFINAGAAGTVDLTIDTNASDSIFGSCGAVALIVNDGHRMRNPKVTSVKGDSVTLESNGGDGWFITSCTGVWEDVGS